MLAGGFAAGVLLTAVAQLALAALLLRDGFSARSKPSAPEEWMARYALRQSVPEVYRAMQNPVVVSAEALAEGRDHFADHCASCHANNGDGHTMYGDGLNPAPPDLRLAATQNKSDGELYSIIQNGVRVTGMPAFGSPGVQDESTWKLVAFIRHLPQLTRAEEEAMKKANPISPTELEEQQEEDDFLKGQKR
jgi:mono/diheme cytochrome c family protein